MIRNGRPLTSHSIAQLRISSGIPQIVSGSLSPGMTFVIPSGMSSSRSDQRNHLWIASSLGSGDKYAPKDSSYEKDAYFLSINSPQVPILTWYILC